MHVGICGKKYKHRSVFYHMLFSTTASCEQKWNVVKFSCSNICKKKKKIDHFRTSRRQQRIKDVGASEYDWPRKKNLIFALVKNRKYTDYHNNIIYIVWTNRTRVRIRNLCRLLWRFEKRGTRSSYIYESIAVP